MAQLDELIVKIKGDVSDLKNKLAFASNQAKSAFGKIKKAVDKIPAPVKNAAGQINKMGGVAAVAAVAGIAVLTKNSLDAADAMAKMGARTGLSTDFLQEMEFAASQTGLASEEFADVMKDFTKNVGEAASGNQTMIDTFNQMGVSVRDANGNLKSSEQIFMEVSDGIDGISDQSEKAAIAMKIFGEKGAKLTNTMKGGSAGISKYRKEAQELGIVIDADLLKNAEAANDKMDILGRVISANVTSAFVELAPYIVDVATNLIEASKGAIQFAKDIGLISERNPKKQIDSLKVSIIDLEQEITELNNSEFALFKGSRLNSKKKELDELKTKLKEVEEQQQSAGNAEAEQAKQDAVTDIHKRGIEARNELRQEQNEKEAEERDQKLLSEIASLEERNALLAEIDATKNAAEIEANQTKIDTLTQQVSAGSNERLAIEAARVAKERELMNQGLNDAATTFGNLMSMSKGSNRRMFEISKAAATATAIQQGWLAVQRALASSPPPYNFIQATAVGTSAAMNVSRIQGTKFNKGTDSVPGIGNMDTVPAVLTPGERVVPRETNKDLTAYLKNAGGKSVVIKNYNTFQGMSFDDDSVKLQLIEVINDTTRELGAQLI